MIRLPISLSKKYQVNQVNTEVSKKHRSTSTYNKPNILILIKIPCKYLVIIPPFPKVIPPCKYLVNHLFLLIYPQTTRMANMIITIICTGMPNNWQQLNYLISHLVMLLFLWKQQRILKILGNQKNKSQPILLEAL